MTRGAPCHTFLSAARRVTGRGIRHHCPQIRRIARVGPSASTSIACMASASWRALVDAQHGVVNEEQAGEHDISAATLQSRLRRGVYQRLGRGTIATFATSPSLDARDVAACLANPTAYLSHFSAGRCWRLKQPRSTAPISSCARPARIPKGRGRGRPPRCGCTGHGTLVLPMWLFETGYPSPVSNAQSLICSRPLPAAMTGVHWLRRHFGRA